MLEERLGPLLTQIRTTEQEHVQFEIVRAWFEGHEENLAESIADMAFVCELPNRERHLLTYPVMGNWYLDKMVRFEPQTEHQRDLFALLSNLVRERRFNNDHIDHLYSPHEEFNRKKDEFNSSMLGDFDAALPLCDMMRGINREISDEVYGERIPKRPRKVDLGHGLAAPSDSFNFLTYYLDTIARYGRIKPLDLTIMVVDDQDPRGWYQRMISVGFKDVEGQQGYFFDGESALKSLRTGSYDVVLTDIELGDGKMNGIDFAQQAYHFQLEQGRRQRIAVFSYNAERLNEANRSLGKLKASTPFSGTLYVYNKARFSAIEWRNCVDKSANCSSSNCH